jgi:hypothetical protein
MAGDASSCCKRKRNIRAGGDNEQGRAISSLVTDFCKTRKIEGDARVHTHHLQNSDAAIAKLRFCESRTVKVVTPIKLPRSSNRPPPEEPSDTGAVIWM